MNCPTCGQEIQGLACPLCTTAKSIAAIFERQGSHLADVRSGRLPFYSKRLSARHPWHLMMFGAKAHAYCTLVMPQVGKNNRTEIRYSQLEEMKRARALCLGCLQALKGIEEGEAIREES